MRRIFEFTRRTRYGDLALFGLLVFGLIGLLALLPSASSMKPTGRAQVIDGDSIIIAGVEMRLEGIDAPEARQNCSRRGSDWPCGREAAKQLARKLAGRQVRCEGVGDDRHGRLLARCWLDKLEINRWLVGQGWAVSFGDYQGEERQAKRGRKGIWAGEFQRPADWRADNHEFR